MNHERIKVSVVDDHPVVMDGLQMSITNRTDMELLGRYASGKQLLEGIKTHSPDVLVMDIKLPDIQGDQLILTVTEKYPKIKVLVMSYLDNLYYVKAMMRLGALGYILKTYNKSVLIDAIKSVAKGEQYIESGLREGLVQQALLSKKDSKSMDVLTKREKEILQLIASNLTSQQIAERLFLSLKTVEFHRSNLLQKLSSKNAAALVKKAMELNLLDN